MGLISCVVTAQLICTFVFAYAKSSFSHETAHIIHVHVLNGQLGYVVFSFGGLRTGHL